ncbi:MAG TPA: indole-3-glycerol phosphate synthase TrpC [Candidatus Glassbacteria bacterium]|nr:indole-3-glycerol phosphate synthase TrpC [Candidatus Glassbacteria bacterium]
MNFLERIIEDKRKAIQAGKLKHTLAEMKARAGEVPIPQRFPFAGALIGGGVALIAEIKKASPSKGVIREDFDPRALALAYRKGGASAISVLTDAKYFQGADEHLSLAKAASGLPVLRKDFILDPWQVYQSRLLGADCILLIAAALEGALLADLAGLAGELNLDVLVEVHDEGELARAVEAGAQIIGVNNRSLSTFEVSLAVSEALAPLCPHGSIKVSESGISSREDVLHLGELGYDAVLVGEHLMRQPDVERAARELLGAQP